MAWYSHKLADLLCTVLLGGMLQLVALFALIQPDEENQAMATLLLPNEVATTIVPMN